MGRMHKIITNSWRVMFTIALTHNAKFSIGSIWLSLSLALTHAGQWFRDKSCVFYASCLIKIK